jgi:hypothetical protein
MGIDITKRRKNGDGRKEAAVEREGNERSPQQGKQAPD